MQRNSRIRWARSVAASLVFLLLLTGCLTRRSFPGDTAEVLPTSAAGAGDPSSSPLTGDSLSAESPGAITSLQDVNKAVILITAQGSFVDFEHRASVHRAGRGSGFIIDPSGIAVTDQHVVNGAVSLMVRVGDDLRQSFPATVIGISECADIAVIQIAGEGFPYLQWRQTEVDTSTPLYLAGYSLADSSFSLSKGVIISTRAAGATTWMALPSLLQYDAYLDKGIVGGPVVDASGQVVGMHQASSTSTRQGFGISSEIARELVEQIRNGQISQALGINGDLNTGENGGPAGLWISSVAPGSLADQAGIRSGDTLIEIGDVDLAQASNLDAYCNLINSPAISETLAVRLLRSASGKFLQGELNGAAIVDEGQDVPGTILVETDIVNPDAAIPGERILSAEFSNIDNWYSFGLPLSDQYTFTVRNSRLYIQNNRKDTTIYALHKLPLRADVRVEAAVETVDGPNRNNISLICRATEKGWYEFSMNSGGYWFIWRYDNGDYQLLNSGASLKIHMQKAANVIMATCVGKTLSLFINDSLMGIAEDPNALGEGQVGVSVSTFDIPGAGVEFDWFRASVP
jgi:S1-C subfamily serine protease